MSGGAASVAAPALGGGISDADHVREAVIRTNMGRRGNSQHHAMEPNRGTWSTFGDTRLPLTNALLDRHWSMATRHGGTHRLSRQRSRNRFQRSHSSRRFAADPDLVVLSLALTSNVSPIRTSVSQPQHASRVCGGQSRASGQRGYCSVATPLNATSSRAR